MILFEEKKTFFAGIGRFSRKKIENQMSANPKKALIPSFSIKKPLSRQDSDAAVLGSSWGQP